MLINYLVFPILFNEFLFEYGAARNIVPPPERSFNLIRRVFAEDGTLTEVMRDHQRNRRRSPVFRTSPRRGSRFRANIPGAFSNSRNGDFPDFVGNLLSLVRRKKYGDPVRVDLPSLGLCNRRTCAKLYEFLEDFRNSNFFANMQTFFSLLQDEDGLDLILDILRDPKLLQELSAGGGKEGVGQPPPKISSSIDAPPDTLDSDFDNYDYLYEDEKAQFAPAPVASGITIQKPEETVRIPSVSTSKNRNNSPTGRLTVSSSLLNRTEISPGRSERLNFGANNRGRNNFPSRLSIRPRPIPFRRTTTPPTTTTTTPGYRMQDDPYYEMYFDN